MPSLLENLDLSLSAPLVMGSRPPPSTDWLVCALPPLCHRDE